MTDKGKLEKLKKLADAMYYAAQQLTTDASRLHKAMDEYHKFIIHECKEEPAEVYKPKFSEGDIIQRKDGDSRKYLVIEIDVELGVYGIASYDETGSYSLDFENQDQWELVEEPVSEDLEEACEQLAEDARKHKAETSSPFFSQTDYKQGVMDGAKWQKQQFEKNRLKHCDSITNEQAELE